MSYHEHNKHASGPELIRSLKGGDSIALVSDAGLPAICDPGADLVRMAVDEAIDVIPVPGANAALSALIMSGRPPTSSSSPASSRGTGSRSPRSWPASPASRPRSSATSRRTDS
ncbi:hypothetical protein LJK88_48575 [Paenibacillus sp. P26]|nr:hypothetical protein LJK88_48575 [Paenibacillus sp. P26]